MIEWAVIWMLLGADGQPVRVVEARSTEADCRAAMRANGHGGLFKATIDGKEVDGKFLYCAWARGGKYEGFVRPDETSSETE